MSLLFPVFIFAAHHRLIVHSPHHHLHLSLAPPSSFFFLKALFPRGTWDLYQVLQALLFFLVLCPGGLRHLLPLSLPLFLSGGDLWSCS
jgi:hypothetical protein